MYSEYKLHIAFECFTLVILLTVNLIFFWTSDFYLQTIINYFCSYMHCLEDLKKKIFLKNIIFKWFDDRVLGSDNFKELVHW